MVRGVCFDLDGTLLDTLHDIADAANSVLRQYSCPPHPVDAYRLMIGDGVNVLFQRALPPDRQDPELIQQCADGFRRAYAECWNVHTKPYPGIPELLDALTRRGLKLAVLSNKPHKHTRDCVAAYLSRWRFETVLGQRDDVPRKPDPAGAHEAAAEMGLPPEQILYLGDTAVDMQTARAAGMFPVGALWGYRSAEELRQAGAEVLIDRPSELLNLLDRSEFDRSV
ncbi:MAG: HAD family hydrolase [Planctomycetes bacterium]|nr:HAD family hydrolase [Planctomycetota bacterium]